MPKHLKQVNQTRLQSHPDALTALSLTIKVIKVTLLWMWQPLSWSKGSKQLRKEMPCLGETVSQNVTFSTTLREHVAISSLLTKQMHLLSSSAILNHTIIHLLVTIINAACRKYQPSYHYVLRNTKTYWVWK